MLTVIVVKDNAASFNDEGPPTLKVRPDSFESVQSIDEKKADATFRPMCRSLNRSTLDDGYSGDHAHTLNVFPESGKTLFVAQIASESVDTVQHVAVIVETHWFG
jgi:hypothetical protein